MLKIRLQRIGRVRQPAYRVVVVEHTRAPKSGDFVEQVGTYNAKTKERSFKGERIAYWLGQGAQASGTVHNMLVSAGVIKGAKVNVLPKKTVPKKEEEAVAAPAPAAEAPIAEASPEAAEEAPAEAAQA